MPKRRDPGQGGLFFVESKGLWRGVVDDGFHPDGRRRQRSVSSKSKREAQRKLDALRAEIKEYGAPLDKSITVEKWARHWLDTVCRPHMKPKPLQGYESVVRTWILPTIGKKRVALLKPSDLRLVTRAIIDAGRSSSTALKAHVIMSSMLESARLDGVIGRNIAKDVVPPKAAPSTRDALGPGVALAALGAASRSLDGTRWWFAILTGMRQGERLGATLDSIDFDHGLFTVQWSLTEAKFEHGCGGTCSMKRGGSCPKRRLITADDLEYRQLAGRLCLVRPKSGRPRTFPMIPELAEALHRYLIATADVPNPHGLIWRNPDGSPITPEQDNAAWRALLLEVGAITAEQAKAPKDRAPGTPEPPTTHWARHTTATVLGELRVSSKVIAAIVGHVSEQTTERIYQHVNDPLMLEAMRTIGDHFAGALAPPAE